MEEISNVIEKAKESCINSGNSVEDHFADVGKIVEAGAASKDIGDIQLSRYACYLIVMNGDPRKEVIALGQTYFAVKTRQQELIEDYDNLSEDRKRLAIRKEMAEHNKLLVAAAKDAGVESNLDYAIFQNYGYQGLYGGLGAKEIHARKELKRVRKYWITWEALNLPQIFSVQLRQRRNCAVKISKGNRLPTIHIMKLGRQTIAELGGTMPEDLPTPEKSIKQIEKNKRN